MCAKSQVVTAGGCRGPWGLRHVRISHLEVALGGWPGRRSMYVGVWDTGELWSQACVLSWGQTGLLMASEQISEDQSRA